MAALAILGLVAPAMAQWTPLAENPAWWPYGDYPVGVGGQPSPSLQSLGLTAYSAETFYNVAGYWPTDNASGVYANNRYYVIGGWGPATLPQDPTVPTPPGTQMYHNNRQSQFGIYEPAANAWNSAKYDGTDLVGYNNGGGGALPTVGQGSYMGTEQGIAYNMDGDATLEILVHGGYPIWSGAFAVYDPDTDTWSNTAASPAFPTAGTQHAGYRGVCEEVGGKIYCVGGVYWGPLGAINYGVYDIATDTWDEDPGNPGFFPANHENLLVTSAYNGFGGAAVGTDIYLLGGGGASDQILKFDTLTETLTNTGVTLQVGVERPTALEWGGLIFVMGGRNQWGGDTQYVQIYDPGTGTVSFGRSLPVEMSRASSAIAPDGTIYVGGCLSTVGSDGTTFIQNNDLWKVAAADLIPEPGVMALFGFGLLALLGLRRRK
jgi:hypothetical protein